VGRAALSTRGASQPRQRSTHLFQSSRLAGRWQDLHCTNLDAGMGSPARPAALAQRAPTGAPERERAPTRDDTRRVVVVAVVAHQVADIRLRARRPSARRGSVPGSPQPPHRRVAVLAGPRGQLLLDCAAGSAISASRRTRAHRTRTPFRGHELQHPTQQLLAVVCAQARGHERDTAGEPRCGVDARLGYSCLTGMAMSYGDGMSVLTKSVLSMVACSRGGQPSGARPRQTSARERTDSGSAMASHSSMKRFMSTKACRRVQRRAWSSAASARRRTKLSWLVSRHSSAASWKALSAGTSAV
jgi:hypothetical protein